VSIVARSEPSELGARAQFIGADLREPGGAERSIERAVQAFGPLDAAVNAAAGFVLEGPKRLHELDDAAFDRELVAEMRIVAGHSARSSRMPSRRRGGSSRSSM
jgi:NAD(P)-dependent dehydrogenase (short-subunit alcohol dehydrogenase family)